ncbi:hypothetical protein GUJ93_ZPchr0010g7419 [Zizania palustris]|uniref:Uncharacterized protein n=1 Tax=Zizania palustris TaxID=103762 RepID=A0A8J5WFM6_ZIZPA|nr:hypothetical protein GUJ93_ZPchr0010g7419 [Zizania palustris]
MAMAMQIDLQNCRCNVLQPDADEMHEVPSFSSGGRGDEMKLFAALSVRSLDMTVARLHLFVMAYLSLFDWVRSSTLPFWFVSLTAAFTGMMTE